MRATESARSENARNLSRFFNESGYTCGCWPAYFSDGHIPSSLKDERHPADLFCWVSAFQARRLGFWNASLEHAHEKDRHPSDNDRSAPGRGQRALEERTLCSSMFSKPSFYGLTSRGSRHIFLPPSPRGAFLQDASGNGRRGGARGRGS